MPAIKPFNSQPFHQRVNAISARVLSSFLLASVPALMAGLWFLGWYSSEGQTLGAGVFLWLPRVVLAMLVSYGWAIVFSRSRGRSPDTGWWYIAWLFILLLPASFPLPLLVVGLSFGLLFGCHVFGGTGRYIVNPALLGAVFLSVAYPAALETQGLTAASSISTWSQFITGGPQSLSAIGISWWDAFLSQEAVALGAFSSILCFVGLIFLAARGLTPWRIPAGAMAGLMVTAWAFGAYPWYWQAITGSFALALAFVATDPTTVPESREGQWSLGLLFGALTVILRTLNPEHPEASLQALLLATLVTPLVDHWATARKNIPEGV